MPDEQTGQDNLDKEVHGEVTTTEQPAETAEAELPEDAKERTKLEFEKLKEHNRQLAEEVERLSRPQPVLDGLRPTAQAVQAEYPNLTQKQVNDTIESLVDDNGYIDEALLKNTLNQANQQVAKAQAEAFAARQEAKQALAAVNKYGQDRETRIAHKKFPQVDPESEKYDPEFFRLVRNELVGAMYEGRKLEFVEACRLIDKSYSPKKDDKQAKAQAVEEYKKSVAQKSALNPTGSSRPQSQATQSDLVEGTMRGDENAIAARLAKINS